MFFLMANVAIFIASVMLCWILGVVFKRRRIFDRWQKMESLEIGAALASIGLNALVSIAGWWLWKLEFIEIDVNSPGLALFHCLAMTLFMDLGMYAFHRVAHSPLIYRWIHSFHHRHETTNPISLFVLHPVEVAGFGGLMISYLLLFPVDYHGLLAYLTINVLWGTLGHSGVEPMPAIMARIPVLRWVGTSTFHAEHHEHPRYNFGFYTLLWDKLFGTLDPDYERRFRQEEPSWPHLG